MYFKGVMSKILFYILFLLTIWSSTVMADDTYLTTNGKNLKGQFRTSLDSPRPTQEQLQRKDNRKNMFGNKSKKKGKYHFTDPENTACMVCSHVLHQKLPILYVAHDQDDGMWQFLCGAEDHQPEQAKIIGLGQVVALDQSLNELNAMPLGVGAVRKSINDKWQPFKL